MMDNKNRKSPKVVPKTIGKAQFAPRKSISKQLRRLSKNSNYKIEKKPVIANGQLLNMNVNVNRRRNSKQKQRHSMQQKHTQHRQHQQQMQMNGFSWTDNNYD